MRIFIFLLTFPLCEASPLWDTLTLIESSENPTKSDSPRPPHISRWPEADFLANHCLPNALSPTPCCLHRRQKLIQPRVFAIGFPDSSVSLNGDSHGSPQIPSALSRSHHPCPTLIHMPQTLSPVAENTSLFKENKMAS